MEFLGVTEIIWLEGNIDGDDTDGHVDSFARFVNETTVVTCYENNKNDSNFAVLDGIYNKFCEISRLKREIDIVKLPMPAPKFFEKMRLPASYANFYFGNGVLLIPSFDDPMDNVAKEIFTNLCPDLEILTVPSLNFIRGQGGIHCLTQQIY